MALSSKPKKFIPKGEVRELKLVHSISRTGADTIKTEEVKTPKKKKVTSKNQSSSPVKHRRLDSFVNEPIKLDFHNPDLSRKRQTLVCFFCVIQWQFSFSLFPGSKRLSSPVFGPRENIFKSSNQSRNSPVQRHLCYLRRPHCGFQMFRLLWSPLVVPVMPIKISYLAAIPPASALEGWIF